MRARQGLAGVIISAVGLIVAPAQSQDWQAQQQALRAPRSIGIRSPEFQAGKAIPRKFTGTGDDVSPPLEWTGVPDATQSIAIIVDDPDAPGGTFTHWLAYGLSPGMSSLAAMPANAAEGVNDFGRRGYGGPCPPRGAAHHYHFVVLALDTRLGLAAGARRSDLDARISGHVLGRGELVATYQRA